MVGVYNGDPAPPCGSDDPQVCNSNGLDFELDDPPLLMVEGAYKYNQERLAGTVKLGGWNHFGDFRASALRSAGGNLIAVTGDPGKPARQRLGLLRHHRPAHLALPGSEEAKGVAVFARVIGAPSDRNLIDFYADGGITFSGMIRKRPDDSFAIGFAYTGISDQVHGFDIDFRGCRWRAITRRCSRSATPCSSATGWTLQPDFQYIWQPGGNVPDENGRRGGKCGCVRGTFAISF